MRDYWRGYGRVVFCLVMFFYIFGALSMAKAHGGRILGPLAGFTIAMTTPSPTPSPDPSHDTGSHQPAEVAHSTPTPEAQAAASKKQTGGGAVAKNSRPDYIGVYSTASPADRGGSAANLDAIANLGANVVYNYASTDGSPDDIQAYLDHAQARGIKVIFSLKDYYDALGSNNWRELNSDPDSFGHNNESFALGIVSRFQGHPATWGFATTDERPEGPWESGSWAGTLNDRYHKIKSLTGKPVMEVLVGHTSANAGSRRSFLSGLRGTTDTFGLDYYPIPYMSVDKVGEIAGDLPAVGDNNGWFVAQSFSWASYPSTASGLGFNVSAARYPTAQEMINMGALALNGGARNILFYSYFDIAGNGAQVNALRQAIQSLRN